MAEFDLLVLGDCNPDLVLSGGNVEPAFGQAERLVSEARLTIGGSGAITACGAARLGLRTAFAGVVERGGAWKVRHPVGDDPLGLHLGVEAQRFF